MPLGIVGIVKINHQLVTLLTQISVFDRVEQVATAAVGGITGLAELACRASSAVIMVCKFKANDMRPSHQISSICR